MRPGDASNRRNSSGQRQAMRQRDTYQTDVRPKLRIPHNCHDTDEHQKKRADKLSDIFLDRVRSVSVCHVFYPFPGYPACCIFCPLAAIGFLKPAAFPAPGGGIDVKIVPHWLAQYGPDTILLIGGSLYSQDDLTRATRRLVDTVEQAAG